MKRLFIASATITACLTVSAMAADLGVRPMPVKAAPAPIVFSWTGFYVGGNAGWIESENSMSNQAIPTPDATLGVDAGVSEGLAAPSSGSVSAGHKSGFIGGGQIGYNYQVTNWLAGVEADIQGISGIKSTGSITTPSGGSVVVGVPVSSTLTGTTDTRWLGTVRGRLGFLPTPTLLLYGTGGLAYGNVTASTSLAQSGTNGFISGGAGSFSETRAGWTAGGGVEWMFARNWSAKLEYLHYDLGTGSFNWAALGTPTSTFFSGVVYQTEATSVHFRGDIVRAGLNYKF
jgi:outer membrane immunogenic protein